MENINYSIDFDINLVDLPKKITDSLENISLIDQKSKDASSKAEKALESAKEAKKKNASFSFTGKNKKEAIESLQNCVVDQSDALTSITEAYDLLFENQKKIIESINYLFALGVTNITANRTIVRILEMRLREASQSELSEFARKELECVIIQLKAQEDLYDKFNKHEKLFSDHKFSIDELYKKTEDIENLCQQTIESVSISKSTIDSLKKRANDTLDSIPSKFDNLKNTLEENLRNHITEEIKNEKKDIENKIMTSNERIEKDINNHVSNLLSKQSSLEMQLNKKSFFDSTIYKVAISTIAIIALICSICSFLIN